MKKTMWLRWMFFLNQIMIHFGFRPKNARRLSLNVIKQAFESHWMWCQSVCHDCSFRHLNLLLVRWTTRSAGGFVQQFGLCTVMLKTELSLTGKLSFWQAIYFSAVTSDKEHCVLTKTTKMHSHPVQTWMSGGIWVMDERLEWNNWTKCPFILDFSVI